MSFKQRLTLPKKLPAAFVPVSEGGKNPCLCKPEGSELPFQNCVFWAWGRWYENTGEAMPTMNAVQYYDWSAGRHKRSAYPSPGALAVWAGGTKGAGHIAVVESVDPQTWAFVTSESGWNNSRAAMWTTSRKYGGRMGQSSAYTFKTFILPDDAPFLNVSLSIGTRGASVRSLQKQLSIAGFLRLSEVDGDYGKITYSAVCGFQCWNGLKVDGIAGPETQAALFKKE